MILYMNYPFQIHVMKLFFANLYFYVCVYKTYFQTTENLFTNLGR